MDIKLRTTETELKRLRRRTGAFDSETLGAIADALAAHRLEAQLAAQALELGELRERAEAAATNHRIEMRTVVDRCRRSQAEVKRLLDGIEAEDAANLAGRSELIDALNDRTAEADRLRNGLRDEITEAIGFNDSDSVPIVNLQSLLDATPETDATPDQVRVRELEVEVRRLVTGMQDAPRYHANSRTPLARLADDAGGLVDPGYLTALVASGPAAQAGAGDEAEGKQGPEKSCLNCGIPCGTVGVADPDCFIPKDGDS